jgi:hypothetical protein
MDGGIRAGSDALNRRVGNHGELAFTNGTATEMSIRSFNP